MTISSKLTTEIQKLAPSAMIELFIVDATVLGGDVLRFHAGTNGLSQNVVWQGETYVRYPVEVSGFEFSGQGQFPRPKMRVANILSAITTVTESFNDLLGAKVTRKRTLAKFLDAVNFEGGVNVNADDTAEFSEDIYYIDRKSAEDRDTVEFELAASVDLVGVAIPRRQIIQNICIWKYRGPECGYTGAPLWDVNDNEITSPASAQAQAVTAAYVAVQTAITNLNLAEATLSTASRTKDAVCDYQLSSRTYSDDGGSPPVIANGVQYAVGVRETHAYFGGSPVLLGTQYRRGPLKQTLQEGTLNPLELYYIEVWAIDSGSCSTATTAYNTALTNRDNAVTALATANSNLATALAALPSDDAIFTQDRCGKRLTSCKLRFGENEPLPYGSFPASGLIK